MIRVPRVEAALTPDVACAACGALTDWDYDLGAAPLCVTCWDDAGAWADDERTERGVTVRRARLFSPAEDRRILALRAEGLAWLEVGLRLGRPPKVIQHHYRALKGMEA